MDVNADQKPLPLWRRVPTELLRAFFGLGLAATGATFAARLWWPFELFCHFRVQYLFGFLVLAGGLLAIRRPKSAAAALALAGLHAAFVLPVYFGPPPAAKIERHIRAVFANVNTANRDHQAFIRLIEAEAPDFFLALEIDDAWQRSLQTLADRYPHHIARPRDDNFGIAFYSRLEPEQLQIQDLGFPVPVVLARLKTNHGSLGIIGAHPPPPAGGSFAQGRNEQLRIVADLAASWRGARLVGGDLNLTSWSPFFSDLLKRSALRDSRQGFGVQPSWPDGFGLMGIPIDHCLVSDEITVIDRKTSASIGSDHFAVIVDLRIENGAVNARTP